MKIGRLIPAIAVNAVIGFGVMWAGWTLATAVVLYWCENVLLIVLLAMRFYAHRALTHKRGHQRKILRTYLAPYIFASFCYGVFLLFFIFFLMAGEPQAKFDPAAFKVGVMWVATALAAGFLVDLIGLKNVSFAELRGGARAYMRRVIVMHLTILAIAWASFLFSLQSIFAFFVLLKAVMDAWPAKPFTIPDKPPPSAQYRAEWLADPTELEQWKHEHEQALRSLVEDELPA